MIRGFYTAGSGLAAQQTAIDNTAHNLANLNTAGFKKQRVSFSELLYSPVGPTQTGNGVRVSDAPSNPAPGGPRATEEALDVSLNGEGFFAVRAAENEVEYTRDGAFHRSAEGDGTFLVTAGGDYVLDRAGGRIRINDDDWLSRVGVFAFGNPEGLVRMGGNRFAATDTSGAPVLVEGARLARHREASNVDLAQEMSDLIAIQRAFQFNAKMIQTADEIENITNTLR